MYSVSFKTDEVKYKLIQMHDGKVFVKLVTMATLSTNSEVQYNSAGTLGQLALICKYRAFTIQCRLFKNQYYLLFSEFFLSYERL